MDALAIKLKDPANLEQIDMMVGGIFNVVILVTMLLCSFSLSSSMRANIMDQAKEIGVLRSLGLKKWRITAMYSYESFILVLASSLLGAMVGTSAALLMITQFSAFMGLPPVFVFPYAQLAFIFLAGLALGLMSSCGPSRGIVSQQISTILKSA